MYNIIPLMRTAKKIWNYYKKKTTLTIEIVRIIRNQLAMGYAIKEISVANHLSGQAVNNVANKISKGMSDGKIIQKKKVGSAKAI